jgi:pSer/pThr/pTyr-binding forkhead associated (FHA) protein
MEGINPGFMYGAQGQANVGVTGGMSAMDPGGPPPDPYAQPAGGAARAVLQGGSGVFTVLPGSEMRVGRDGAQCGILLTEPRVSGVHASAKLESGQLLVRDDNSNNGTLVNGNRLNPGVWTPVPNGSLVRFGPVEFNVRLE